MTNIYINQNITGTKEPVVADETSVGSYLKPDDTYNVSLWKDERENAPTHVKTYGRFVGESVAKRSQEGKLALVVVHPEGAEPTSVRPVIRKGGRFTID